MSLKSTFTKPYKHLVFAVSVDIYKMRMHQSNILQDKMAVYPNLLHFFEIKFHVWKPVAATADIVRIIFFWLLAFYQ